MCWITASAIVGGLIVGFMAGASPSATGGNVATAVAALQLAILGLAGKPEFFSAGNAELVGQLFLLFLGCLLVSYILGNVLRHRNALVWMGISST